ncbi:methyltransferase domain-containing protein [Halomonas sp. YLGW01]|uniref:methyltransferase domain-containing protein n=1 Tax=Halomonas sp. YLGW01 TaxID=2773308 RepID=UPI00177F6F02|nr:methyltransferase domain-containing protein [Halomonas sp. YLGW01]
MTLATAPSNATPEEQVAAASSDWRRRVAHAFSRAAPRYGELATAQQAMGEALWQRLPDHATRVLDLGCGPGHWTARLAHHYSKTDASTRVVGLDLAPGMLAQAREQHGQRLGWLCGDAAQLPLADASLDLVFSNLAIQWCPDLDAVLQELQRVLRPGGRALLNTLGPGTLAEVGWAWSRPGALLTFLPPQVLEQSAHQAGFDAVDLEQVGERFHYPDLPAVMASIKGVGAQLSRPASTLTRRDVAGARERYEQLRDSEGLPVTYQRLTLDLLKT